MSVDQPPVALLTAIGESRLDTYKEPSQFFVTNLEDKNEDKNDAYEQGYKVGVSVGEGDTNPKLWTEALNIAQGPLDAIYNYRSIMYDTLVLPKRLQIIQGGRKKHDNFLTQNGYTLNVIGDFEIANNPITWRDWFPKLESKITVPEVQEFPITSITQKSWSDGLEKGYLQGVCLTYLDFLQAMKYLDSDFRERFTYVLASQRGLTKGPELSEIKIPLELKKKSAEIDRKITKLTDKGNFVEKEAWGKMGQ
ncbi:type IV secretory system conjugative DNA transfer family protein [Marinomonas sp. TI.3.20]|uniref:type IV secretory system conjugative DNA transfer family protein n=1 Tax=Marinomonas sp. TI.3.20 TaxID=3121296 RepID=UPI00311E2604